MRFLGLRNCILVLAAAGWLLACGDESPAKSSTAGAGGGSSTGSTTSGTSTTGTSTTGASTTTGATTGDTTAGTSTTGAGGSTGTTTTGAGGTGPTDMAAPLPFTVDSLFIASGFMGDGSTPGAIVQDDNMTCMASRPMGATGHCHKFTYTPGALAWGGVYWQYPVNNWGAAPGKRIAQGATKVTFYASGAAGGESVKFIVGGMMGMAYTDTVNASLTVALTTTPTPYIIDLTGQTYDAVLGGFGWTAEAPMGSTAPISFTVDSITWAQ